MAKKVEKSYGNESIIALKGADRVRKRPAVIFGSDGITGCQHAIFEIITNSIDEAKEGYGKKIEITRHADRSITVKDYGRGVPVDYNPLEKKFNWELVFCELYAGGKYENNEDGYYEYSLGLNGLGLCATQYASEYMNAVITRDGFRYTLNFQKGENVGGLKKEPFGGNQTGTAICWRPDRDVFTEIEVELEWYRDILKRQAIVNDGLTFILKCEETGTREEFFYENGIRDYMNELVGEAALTPAHFLQCGEVVGRDRADKPEYRLKFDVVFCFSNDVNILEYYHNSSHLIYGGSPDKAVRAAFVHAVDAYIRAGGHYKKDEKKIAFHDIEESLVLITNSFSTITSYENQTKRAITNIFIQHAMADFLKKNLEVYFVEHKADADRLCGQILANKRSRESVEKTRVALKKKLTGQIDLNNRVEKFVGCRSRDASKRELYIVEGDSALGSCKMGRDAEFQAIMPVRGKIFNCLKADYNRILQSEIITDLLRVIGCGVEISGKKSKGHKDSGFDINKLTWNRIIICTDADYDGYHIRTLILTMLYRLTPSLIDRGRVYIAESPLYEISVGKEVFFAYTEKEKADILAKAERGGKKAHIQRSKGLGENEPEMMWQTTMNPATRRLVQVIPAEAAQTREMFETLLGDNIKARKDFIEEFGHLYLDMAEAG